MLVITKLVTWETGLEGHCEHIQVKGQTEPEKHNLAHWYKIRKSHASLDRLSPLEEFQRSYFKIKFRV